MPSFTVRRLTPIEQSEHGKRFVAYWADDGQRVYFGQPGAYTYTDGASRKVKLDYLRRHGATGREDWSETGRRTAGFLSRWILWGPYKSRSANVWALCGDYLSQ